LLLRGGDRRPARYKVTESERFEFAFKRLQPQYPVLWELWKMVAWNCARQPETGGQLLDGLKRAVCYVAELPRLTGTPEIRMMYEVREEEQRVILWSLSAKH
jgi:hypothetical protein